MLGRFATEALPLLGMRALTWQRHLDRKWWIYGG